jgi:hypothetical protein
MGPEKVIDCQNTGQGFTVTEDKNSTRLTTLAQFQIRKIVVREFSVWGVGDEHSQEHQIYQGPLLGET